ncbi:hypothetical protein NLJ89_g11216 [Agrocybe chaxingu]|uniref:Uncharacterized protein n=1 Tax=Agrocybe chaxingu TaxID=84603 RepID=A0A9W8MPK1_9AGAR|nr:hypothetical protein NLJ89_g11216 [Agrocybe chaxingu]
MNMFRSRIFYGYLSFLISTWALSSALFLFFSLATEILIPWIYFRKDQNLDPSSLEKHNSKHAQTEELDSRTHAMAAIQTDLLLDKDSASDALQQKTYASFGAQTSTERLTGSTVAKSEPSNDKTPAFSSLSAVQQSAYTLRGMVHDNIGALREKTSQVVNIVETPGILPKAIKQLHSIQTVLKGSPTRAYTLHGAITPPPKSTTEHFHLPLAARIGARVDLDSPEVTKKRHRLRPKQAQQDARDREELTQFLLDDD